MNKIVNDFNINKNTLNFKGNNMEQQNLTIDEQRVKIVDYCSKKIAETSEKEIPNNGKFSTKRRAFEIPGTNNLGIFSISYNVENPKDLRDVNIAVQHKNSDRTYNNFAIFTGTKQEVLEYLNNIDTNLAIKSFMELSDKIDEYYSNL